MGERFWEIRWLIGAAAATMVVGWFGFGVPFEAAILGFAVLVGVALAAPRHRSRRRLKRVRGAAENSLESTARAIAEALPTPCFIIDQKYAVMGAQAPEVIAGAIDKALEDRAEAATS